MRSVVSFAALALAASVIVPRYASHVATPRDPADMAQHAQAEIAVAATGLRSVTVERDARGHFEIDGRIDGRRLTFVVDTGASVIALTASAAAQLGIHPARSEFVAEVRTANGTVRGAPTQLDSVQVGELTVRDVTAIVLPDEALSDNLLGLSFLSRLRRFEYNGGKLVLEQ